MAPEIKNEPQAKSGLQIGGKLLARNTVINLTGRIVPMVIAIAAMPYVIHHLGPDRYGLLSLVWIVVGYFALFNLGIGPATTKFVSELLGKGEHEKLPELVWTAVISQTCLGLVAAVLLAAAAPLLVNRVLKIPPDLHGQAHLIFLILAVALPIDFASGSVSGVLAASQRFDLLNFVSIPGSALNYLLPVAALALGYGLPSIVFVLVLARLASFFLVVLLCLRLYPALCSGPCFDRHLLQPLVGFGGWLTLSGILAPLLLYADRFVIGAAASIAAVGYYSLAFSTLQRLHFLPGALAGTLFPAFSSLQSEGAESRTVSLFLKAHKYLFLVIVPVLVTVIFFAGDILTLWIGRDFSEKVALPFRIIAVGMLIALLAPLSGALMRGRGRPDVLCWIYLAELPVNTILTWELASRWGVVGASLSFSIRAFAETALVFVVAVKVSGLKLWASGAVPLLRVIAFVALSALLISIAWGAVAEPFEAKALLFAATMVGYFFVSYRYGLDPGERRVVRGAIAGRWSPFRQVRVS